MLLKIINNKYFVKGFIICSCLLLITAVTWIISIIIYQTYMSYNIYLLIVSYILGLKHALDADHIATIDNVTNKLILSGQEPLTVGLYFSLGHSTIVIIVSILLATLTNSFNNVINSYNEDSDLIGSIISSSFLLIIGFINVFSVCMIYKNLITLKNTYENELINSTNANEEISLVIDWKNISNKNGCFSFCFGSF